MCAFSCQNEELCPFADREHLFLNCYTGSEDV